MSASSYIEFDSLYGLELEASRCDTIDSGNLTAIMADHARETPALLFGS